MTRRNLLAFAAASAAHAARPPMPSSANIGFRADTGPPRSECGIGALMPWADALWLVTYNSHTKRTGTGLGLFRVDEELRTEQVHLHNGTHANRLVHKESSQVFIGPYAIDAKGNWRFLEQYEEHRLTATIRHLSDPAGRVYMLTMEGLLFEHDVATHKSTLLADVVKEFRINKRPHFKGGCSGQGRVLVTNNGFYAYGENEAGLFEFDGANWRALSRKPHMDAATRADFGQVVFCTGWDESSVLLWALVGGKWQRYRLPKASHAFQHAWQTEWMRIREVETEHFLMDMHGMFYELQPLAFENAIWGVKPICQHLRIIPDYCAFRGLLALGGNQTTPNSENNPLGGQPQSGLWLGKTDDLWSWGRPQGWGGPWRKTAVRRDQPSDPFLMTGFRDKCLHLATDKAAEFDLEIDFLGDGGWKPYARLATGAEGYKLHVFPPGFSAHWIRLTPRADCVASAEFMYT
ncbi:MAG: hypothetical protein SFV51_15375 [Bryobacteraceae bacterium]|nr:hypothetical protein [Bryobacteraceae bacterium]